jgi:Fe-S oxidoreductase
MIEQGDLVSVPVEWDKPDYWNAESLDKELRRQYDVCNSCRLCFNLCPAFPRLFVHFDTEEVDNDPDKLNAGQVAEFVDLCYNCKLCFIKCPYTPPHKFLIDIPRLVMRARAVDAKENGVDLRERMLSSPDEIGKVAALAGPLLNWANTNRFNRRLMERFFGVHRDKLLPRFAAETFASWFRRHISTAKFVRAQERPRVAIFHTCIVNYNEPQIGRAMVGVLDRNNVEVADPADQVCCGMPYLDSGRLEKALEHFRQNLRALLSLVRQGLRHRRSGTNLRHDAQEGVCGLPSR